MPPRPPPPSETKELRRAISALKDEVTSRRDNAPRIRMLARELKVEKDAAKLNADQKMYVEWLISDAESTAYYIEQAWLYMGRSDPTPNLLKAVENVRKWSDEALAQLK
jgi:hypothetical protein